MPLVLFVISWVFSALICMPYVAEASLRWFINWTSSRSCPAKSSISVAKRKFVFVLPSILTVPSWCVSHYSLSEDTVEGGGEQTSLAHSRCGSEPFFYVIVMVDCAGRLVVEEFYGSVQVGIDVIQPHGCPQSCMPYSVERLLEVHEDMIKALLVLQVFLTEYSKIEILLSCAPSCSGTCLFLFDDLQSLWLQSIQEYS